MSSQFPQRTDDWLLDKGPYSEVVISSRARLARNLAGARFAPRAAEEELAEVASQIGSALRASDYFKDYIHLDVSEITGDERRFLRESHLISTEFEKGLKYREVYLSQDGQVSIMVNEEDHLRIQAMVPGLQLDEVYRRVEEVEHALEKTIQFAYSPQFGYLTACPTNTGTGFRVSVMLHLVGLVMTNQTGEALGSLGNLGLVVRGASGENSGHLGDIFQVSNEVTLGRDEESLIGVLGQVVTQIIERELGARSMFHERDTIRFEDAVQRALGILSHARSIDSKEAVGLLSRVRLGVGGDFGISISHEQLNRLIIDVQPGHLRRSTRTEGSVEGGDQARAALLREKFRNGGAETNN